MRYVVGGWWFRWWCVVGRRCGRSSVVNDDGMQSRKYASGMYCVCASLPLRVRTRASACACGTIAFPDPDWEYSASLPTCFAHASRWVYGIGDWHIRHGGGIKMVCVSPPPPLPSSSPSPFRRTRKFTKYSKHHDHDTQSIREQEKPGNRE